MVTKRGKIVERITKLDENALFMDGFDTAIVGYFRRCGQPLVVAYDYDKCLALLQSEGMSEEEAQEYFDFNCEGAWVGDRTPAILHAPEDEEIDHG